MLYDKQKIQDIYLAFNRLEVDAYRDRVRFYDEHLDLLDGLDFQHRIEIDINYAISLFEIGQYHKFLTRVDFLIEQVITENVSIDDRDIFCDLLFRKGASLYNVWQLEEAEYVIAQLHRINPDYPATLELLYKCRSKVKRPWFEALKAMCVVFFLLGASMLVVQHLIVDPFYHQFVDFIVMVKTMLLASSVGFLLIGVFLVRLQSDREVKELIK